jgi:integrase
MVKPKKYLWRHPEGRVYVRIKGKLHRIHASEGTPEFDREYWDILTGRKAEAKQSWRALIVLFRESDKWAAFSPRYRRDLEPVFVYLEDKIGTRDVARLTQADIYAAMDSNKHRVRFANYIPTAVSMLSKLAVRRRWRTDNPALGIEPLAVPKTRKQAHVPWTDAAVAKWRAEAAPLPRLIFELGVGSVQRPGDLIDFTWGDYDGDALQLRQNKTDKPLLLPCTEALRVTLERVKAEIGGAPTPRGTSLPSRMARAWITAAWPRSCGMNASGLASSSVIFTRCATAA